MAVYSEHRARSRFNRPRNFLGCPIVCSFLYKPFLVNSWPWVSSNKVKLNWTNKRWHEVYEHFKAVLPNISLEIDMHPVETLRNLLVQIFRFKYSITFITEIPKVFSCSLLFYDFGGLPGLLGYIVTQNSFNLLSPNYAYQRRQFI